jgi:hypothetical protein
MGSAIGSVAGSLLGGAAGASAGPASVGSVYPNAFQNSQTYMTDLGNQQNNLSTLQSTAAPAALSNYNTASSNPYASLFQTGAGNAATAYNTAGTGATNMGNTVAGYASPLASYANQVMQLGLDPQNSLYNQQLQNATDTANATNAGYGLTGPWAAGNTNQAVQSFNQNWTNQQLQRALSALSGGASADQSASSLDSQASQLQQTGAGDLYTGAGLPYNTAQGISSNQNVNLNDLINNLGGINNIDQGTMSSLLQYLAQASGYGLQANQQTNQAAAAGASGGANLGGIVGGAMSLADLFA